MGQPVPQVPYGGAESDPDPTPSAPRWLRRLFDDEQPVPDPAAGSTVLLAEPPREVPLAFRLSALALGPWEAFALGMTALAPMALWVTYPHARTAALVVGAVLVVATRARRYRRRVGVLRWGRVATVTSSAGRASGSTFTNWPMRQARGWDASTRLYSGRGTTTEVQYTLDGQPGSLTLRGLRYVDGVVLADSRHPQRAMEVSQFPHSVRPGLDGRLVGRLAPGRWAWTGITLALQVALVVLAARSVWETWVR